MDKDNTNSGFSLIEITVATSILAFILIGFISFAVFSLKAAASAKFTQQAVLYAQEAMEAVRSFRDSSDWSVNGLGVLPVGSSLQPYIPATGTTTWSMAAGSESIGGYGRSVILSRVSRDPLTGNIQSSYVAANDDPRTLRVTVTVTWNSRSLSFQNYLTDWK